MNTLFKKFIVLALLVFGSLGFYACQTTESTNDVLANDNQIFTLEAISATSLLQQSTTSTTTMSMPLAMNDEMPPDNSRNNERGNAPVFNTTIEDVDKYVEMMEKFLGNPDDLNVVSEVNDNPDYPDYEYVSYFTTIGLDGTEKTYTIYYNEVDLTDDGSSTDDQTTTEDQTTTDDQTTTEDETSTDDQTTTENETTTSTDTTAPLSDVTTTEDEPVTTEDDTETDDDNDGDDHRERVEERAKDREFNFDDQDDDAVTVYIEGIMIDGNNTYNLEGKKIVEDDEEKVRLYSYIDKDNFVKVDFKSEDNGEERKFHYVAVTDGLVSSRSRVKVENEDDEIKVMLDIDEEDYDARYMFKKEIEDGDTVIKIMYDVTTSEGREKGIVFLDVLTDPETGETYYEYSIRPGADEDAKRGDDDEDGDEYKEQRGRHFDDDDDDDEDNEDNDDMENNDDDDEDDEESSEETTYNENLAL